MSHDIIYASRARLDGENLVLEVKSYSNNVRPWPTFAEQKRADYQRFSRSVPANDPEAIACYLETLARDYDGGSLKERGKDISGEVAYGLWAKRVQKVLPDLELRKLRRSRVVYDFCQDACRAQRAVPFLPAGTVLTAEVASMLVAAGIHPRVRTTALRGGIGYVAFVNGGICVARQPGAKRGYYESSPVLVKAVEAQEGRKEICPNKAAECAIQLDAPGEAIRFVSRNGYCRTALSLVSSGDAIDLEVGFFTAVDAAEIKRRLAADCPEVAAAIVTREDARIVLASAVLLGAEPVTAPA